ncbi:MAG: T9SS type A sorting domain-containing protein [Ignavibacteria bacterium]|nr:T9SS type A sorting domain-containing protein [Ignavibacteria bacterium]
MFNSPRVAIGDFNRNGRTDLLFGDSNADFFIVESSGGGNFHTLWATVNDYADGGDFVAAGDFDGDGSDEFAIGFRTLPEDVIPFWYFGIYRLDGQNKAVPLWSQHFFGIEEGSQYGSFSRIQNSLSTGNLDADADPELLISVFPELYVIDYDRASQQFRPAFTLPLVNTNAATIADFDGNGVAEFAIAGKDSVSLFERDLPYAGPPLMRSFDASYVNDAHIRLVWSSDPPAARYRLYKGATASTLSLFGTLESTAVSDFDIVHGQTYVYAVAAFDSTLTPAESPRMFSRIFAPHALPELDTAIFLQNGQVKAVVTQDMGTVIPAASSFILNDGRSPESVALLDRHSLLLSFGALVDGSDALRVRNLRDAEGLPFDEQVFAPFEVLNTRRAECFIERVDYVPPRGFDVLFSLPVEKATAEVATNYVFQPLGAAASASVDAQNARLVHVQAASSSPIGAIGKEYVLAVHGVVCTGGIPLTTGAGSSAGVVLNRQTLDDVFVFPNPLRARDAQEFITFANLTARAKIRIYTVSGLFIREIEESDGNGGLEWNLLDENGSSIPAGVYIFHATGFDSQGREVTPKTGKFAVAR